MGDGLAAVASAEGPLNAECWKPNRVVCGMQNDDCGDPFYGGSRWPEGRLVAVGTAVARYPPHSPVLALLAHTVPTSDIGMLGVEPHARIGLQDPDRR
jgi:hypothetical protein